MQKKSQGNFLLGMKQKKAIQRNPIIVTDADYDYIMDEIECRGKIEFGRNASVDGDEELH